MAAFFDDSGVFRPEDSGKFVSLGMVVVPSAYIRKCGDAWWELLQAHLQSASSLQTIGIEVKSSELCNLSSRLKTRDRPKLQNSQQKIFECGLNTTEKVDKLIEEIFNFLSKPPVTIKYLAVVADKDNVWQRFRDDGINQLRLLTQSLDRNSKKKSKKISNELSSFLVKHTYEFLLQRLDYLSRDGEEYLDFSDAFVIGDESSDINVMLRTQAEIQAGLGKHFSPLPTIVNRPWFGSSLHDPCLQMADWIAFAVRTWAEESRVYSQRIIQLLPNFRGGPDGVIGKGIVLCPDKECFPNLPIMKGV